MSMLAFCYRIPWEKGVSKMLGWCFAIGWGQPTIGALQLEWLWFYDISLHVFLTLSIGFKKHFITLLGRSYSLKNLDCHKLSQVLGVFMWKVWQLLYWPISQESHRSTATTSQESIDLSSYRFLQYSLKSERGTISRKLKQNWEEWLYDTPYSTLCVGMCEFWHV